MHQRTRVACDCHMTDYQDPEGTRQWEFRIGDGIQTTHKVNLKF